MRMRQGPEQWSRGWLPIWWQWRAKRIEEPVERLRYLRRATHEGTWQKTFRLLWQPQILVGSVVILFLVAPGSPGPEAAGRLAVSEADAAMHRGTDKITDVWMVERRDGNEVYSNGLQVDTRSTTPGERRSYVWLNKRELEIETGTGQPVGIVFHTTESHIDTFEREKNARLSHVAGWLLNYVRAQHSYHYLIDRFGRVYRVVPEQDSADHAGSSIWADRTRVYLGLNGSFLGVAFESETQPGDRLADSVTPAQVRAGRALTEMLRARYQIPAENCVTHAQVSINNSNRKVGNHTDWAGNFPFAETGLPDNYALPIAAVSVFGFSYDDVFLRATGSRLWRGLDSAEQELKARAAEQYTDFAIYRKQRQQKFKDIMHALPDLEETASEK